jgi:hypothetical protein
MMRRLLLFACLGTGLLPAQWQLSIVQPGQADSVAPISRQYSFGTVPAYGAVTVQFSVQNTSTATVPLAPLSVNAPFSIVDASALPQTLAAQGTVGFSVSFAPVQPGSYGATLSANGVALVVLVGTAPPGPIVSVGAGTGVLLAGGAAIDFGSVMRGSTTKRQVTVTNPPSGTITVQHVAVVGAGFQLETIALPTPLPATLEIDFSPTSDGPLAGRLEIDQRVIPLTGVGLEPPFPQPAIAIAIAKQASSQQGTLTVNLASASQATGTGAVQIVFQPSTPGANTDSAIEFLSPAGQTATFNVSQGDTAGHFGSQNSVGFQTGTTAGSIVFTVTLGDFTETKTLTIASAAVTIDSSQAQRTSAGLNLLIDAFDNTRSASKMIFTFFDQSGNTLNPGAIPVDGSSAFQKFFASSDEGGVFALQAFFPVTVGTPSLVDSVDVQFVNSTGTSPTAKLYFTTP